VISNTSKLSETITESPVSRNSESHWTDDFFSATDQVSVSSEREDNTKCGIITHSKSIPKEHPVEIVTFYNSFREENCLTEVPNLPNISSAKNTVVQTETISKVATIEQLMCEGKVLPQREIRRYEMADQVYEKAKKAWSFGKGVSVLKPIMGLAEGVAAKAINVTVGVDDLEKVDILIRGQLNSLDKDLVDPAINRLWEVISPYVKKGDDIVQTIIRLKGKKISQEAEVETTESSSDVVEDTDIGTKPPPSDEIKPQSDKITPTPIAPTH